MANPPALPMSYIISPDAPLLSPVQEHAMPPEPYYMPIYLPPSPPLSTTTNSPVPDSVLRMRMSPDSVEPCLPTHQLFDLSQVHQLQTPPSPASSSASLDQQCMPISVRQPTAMKRSASPAPPPVKRRATGERVSTKDFVPPDVSGLSKREARLVKNRAAAFLSRQRKREDRVAELEQENARLLALTQSGASPSSLPKDELASEVEQLRMQLAAAREREQELSAELAKTSSQPPVKVESDEPSFSGSSSSSKFQSAHKTAASLGLMVLLCALPSLLSVSGQSNLPTSFSIPSTLPSSSSSLDMGSFVPSDFDWSSSNPLNQKLEFSNPDLKNLAGFSGLDISFDTTSSEDGKIRVRIHPTSSGSSTSSRAASPSASIYSGISGISGVSSSNQNPLDGTTLSPATLDPWGDHSLQTAAFPSSVSADGYHSAFGNSHSPASSDGDPFFGVGASYDEFSMNNAFSSTGSFLNGQGMNGGDLDYASEFGFGSEYSGSESGKRRVKIALKAAPQSGNDCGEWEVRFC
ncbi:hypothetical protein K435DRAFT_850346 [Dendrothele bispora CBS 962.96]|uniref:BZIP domain-containing protein n=1 Tax=Dendrothele bispora (strain CBS 962.96) TaxID=1314807 RepID=A0A4S8MQI1_DENBC|nr:hypothetical protein K435DRAFT_850346 [Dendrothele bispora CBS 962.96]